MLRRCRNRQDPNPRGQRFRLLWGFTVEHNARRLQAYIKRLARADALSVFKRRTRLRKRLAAIKAGKRGA